MGTDFHGYFIVDFIIQIICVLELASVFQKKVFLRSINSFLAINEFSIVKDYSVSQNKPLKI